MNIRVRNSRLMTLGTESPQVPPEPTTAFPLCGHRPVDSASCSRTTHSGWSCQQSTTVSPWERAGQVVALLWANVKIDSPSDQPSSWEIQNKSITVQGKAGKWSSFLLLFPGPEPDLSRVSCRRGRQGPVLQSRPAASYQVAELGDPSLPQLWFSLCYLFRFFRVAPEADGSSQARGQIGAVATGRYHSHSNAGSQPCL